MIWSVQIPRERLLERLRTNRDNHQAKVQQAWAGFRDAAIAELERRIEAACARDPKELSLRIELPRPEDHSPEHDTIIGMLELSSDETVEVGAEEFRSYVEDVWDWTERWLTTTGSYSRRRELGA